MRRRILVPIRDKDKSHPLFSEEWAKHNSWMKEENEKAEDEASTTLTKIERFLIMPPCFLNFPDGIPMPKVKEEMKRKYEFMKEQKERLAIFHEMLSEKSIRPGREGIGEPYKGWGRSARK